MYSEDKGRERDDGGYQMMGRGSDKEELESRERKPGRHRAIEAWPGLRRKSHHLPLTMI